ncbi:hypothetical protein U5U50_01700 [Mycoplasma sp. 888]|uniref:hypothetical protein n=1 Tax=Mycoplasma sp. 888 TaxID=3108483 RepID=UPI002D766F09|nr:hypothetical protein [Mycoplasma sp. 888]WRQ26096.1 hypothetical protein U5U50_01700 [Mycoplasma sp. 888]
MDKKELLFIQNMGLSFEEFKNSEFNMLVPFKTPKKLSKLMSNLDDEQIYNKVIYSVYNSVNALINSVVSLVAKKVDYKVEQFKNAIGDDRFELLKKAMFHEVNNRYTNNAIPEVNSRLTLLGNSTQLLGTQREFVFAEQHLNPIAAKLLYDGEWDSLGVEIIKGLDKISGFASSTDLNKVNEDIKGFKNTVETKTEQIDIDIRNLKLSAKRIPSSMELEEIRKNIQMDKVQASQILDNSTKITSLEEQTTSIKSEIQKLKEQAKEIPSKQFIEEVKNNIELDKIQAGKILDNDAKITNLEQETTTLKSEIQKSKEETKKMEQNVSLAFDNQKLRIDELYGIVTAEDVEDIETNPGLLQLVDFVKKIIKPSVNITEEEQFTGEFLEGYPIYKKLIRESYNDADIDDNPSVVTLFSGVKDLINIEGSFVVEYKGESKIMEWPIFELTHAQTTILNIENRGWFRVEDGNLVFDLKGKTSDIFNKQITNITINTIIKYTKLSDEGNKLWDKNKKVSISPNEYIDALTKLLNK